jgi:hypothetical protein
MTLDLATAYPGQDRGRWRRTARLDRTANRVTVTDTWELDPAPEATPSAVHYLLAGEVALEPGRAIVTSLAADTVVLSWLPPLPAEAVVRTLDDPMLSGVWGDHLTRLSIDLGTGTSGCLTASVEVLR